MGTPFKFTIDICQPDKGTYAKIVMSQGSDKTIWDEAKCGGCPFTEEELKKLCPKKEEQVEIYAWDPINQFEAEDEAQKQKHVQNLAGEAYVWLDDCKKCLDCGDIGSDSYSEYHYCKCAENDPNLLPIACPGAKIGPITLRSEPFSEECLKAYDVYAKVFFSADNWGTVYGADAGDMISCSNEGTTQCDDKCSGKQGDVKCIINSGIIGGSAVSDDGAPQVTAQVFADATNSSNGGPYSLFVVARFYFKKKPTE
jgi:hypothetical protein